MEFALSTLKPTLYVNTKLKAINKDYNKIKTKPIDIEIRNKIGKEIEKEETRNINKIVNELILNQEKYKAQNLKMRSKYLFNVGNSSKVGAKYIIKKLEERKCKQ